MSSEDKVTDQQYLDTEVALSHFWCGTDWDQIVEGFDEGQSYTDDAVRGAKLMDRYEDLTIKLLTLWRGYLDANEDTGIKPTVEDFVIATYVINRQEVISK